MSLRVRGRHFLDNVKIICSIVHNARQTGQTSSPRELRIPPGQDIHLILRVLVHAAESIQKATIGYFENCSTSKSDDACSEDGLRNRHT